MRLFTAIPLPQSVKDGFTSIAHGKLPISYVNTTNFHITLNFLGEVDTDHVESLKKWWEQMDLPVNPFVVEFDKIVKFGHQIHMTVKVSPELVALQEKMAHDLLELGYKPQHETYYPHVTIGTMHMDKVMNAERKFNQFPNELLKDISFEVNKIVLYESKYLLHHSHYTEILTKSFHE